MHRLLRLFSCLPIFILSFTGNIVQGQSPALPSVVKVEYYLDIDPGFGNGSPISINPGANLPNQPLNLNLSSVATGLHQFHIRALDNNGNWSLNNDIAFVRINLTDNALLPGAPPIVQAEYYIDTDPGFGKAMPVSLIAGTPNQLFTVNLSGITTGIHQLHIRSKDGNGGWSLNNDIAFVRINLNDNGILPNLPSIVQAEYYIDTDPGFGKAAPVSLIAGTPNQLFTVNLSGITTGIHQLHIRSKDANGSWSLNNDMPFVRIDLNDNGLLANIPLITQAEYYIDTDPGFGKGINILFLSPGTDLSNLVFNIDLTKLSTGNHYLHTRALDANGSWSLNNLDSFFLLNTTPNSPIITTIAGNGVAGFAGDGGLATAAELNTPDDVQLDAAGNIYIADALNNRIREVNATTSIITTFAGGGTGGPGGPATSAGLGNPNRMTFDKAGNLFICDNDANEVVKVAASTGTISVVAGSPGGGYSGDGGPATAALLFGPTGVAVDPAGNIYIADIFNFRIRRVDAATGIISTIAGNGTAGFNGDGGPASAAEINYPTDVALDASGNIYIADLGNNRIRRIDGVTGIISTVAGNGTGGYAGDGGPATSAELNQPTSVFIDPNGNMIVADEANSVIRKIGTDGTITTIAGNGTSGYSGDGGPALAAEITLPFGAVTDPAGNLYIVDRSNRIREVGSALPASGSGITAGDQWNARALSAQPLTDSGIIQIFPNPTHTFLNIELPGTGPDAGSPIRINLYDMAGRLIQSVLPTTGNTTQQLNVQGLAAGTYVIQILQGPHSKNIKFIKI